MQYLYPTIQDLCQGAVFIIANDFVSNKYESYRIPYRDCGAVLSGYIYHNEVGELIEKGLTKIQVNQRFASGKQFIRIPIKYLRHDTLPMETTEGLSKELF
jgi:hypothetical protein